MIESNGQANGTRRVIDRLASIAVPILLGALGVVLWSLLTGVVEGVDSNQTAIVELQVAVENLTDLISDRTDDRWTATQDEQQQVIQALVDTAQNGQSSTPICIVQAIPRSATFSRLI